MGRLLLHISQFLRPGWLAKVHRGQIIAPDASVVEFDCVDVGWWEPYRLPVSVTAVAARFVLAVMAALRT